MSHVHRFLALAVVVAPLAVLGCDDDDTAAPPSTPLEQPQATSSGTARFDVDAPSSNATFLMEAPIEHIRGRAPASVTGQLDVDLGNLARSRGLVKVDLTQLAIYQTKREDETSEWGQETRDETQNEHMRTWFQISPDAPEDVREQNRWVEFSIEGVTNVSESNVNAMTGAERRVTAEVSGQLRLHGRSVNKTARVEIVFEYEGDRATAMRVHFLEPVNVGLEEHDVRPRSAFDRLAERTLAALGQKVASNAPIELEFTARRAD